MKSSFMKLNHVSTFSGKGPIQIFNNGRKSDLGDFRKKVLSTLLLLLFVSSPPSSPHSALDLFEDFNPVHGIFSRQIEIVVQEDDLGL